MPSVNTRPINYLAVINATIRETCPIEYEERLGRARALLVQQRIWQVPQVGPTQKDGEVSMQLTYMRKDWSNAAAGR